MNNHSENPVSVPINDAKNIIEKIIPNYSPCAYLLQSLTLNLIAMSPCYLMTVTNFEPQEIHLLSDEDCQLVIKEIKSHNNTKTWAVSYMLADFLQHYRELSVNSNAWQFMSRYLQLIWRIAEREDKHFNRIYTLSVRVRMALSGKSNQKKILDFLFEKLFDSKTPDKDLEDLIEFEKVTNHNEVSGKEINYNLAKKIGQIRLAFEVVLKDKKYIEKNRNHLNQQKNALGIINHSTLQNIDESVREIRFLKPNRKNNVAYQEELADESPPSLLDNDFKPTTTTAKSSQLQQFDVKTNYLHSRRNSFSFPSNTRVLSLINYQQLYTKLIQLTKSTTRNESLIAKVLVLSLLSGRQIATVVYEISTNKSSRELFIDDGDGGYVLTNKINVVTNRQDSLKKHLCSDSKNFTIPLPHDIASILQFKLELNKQDINNFIRDLKQSLRLPTLSRQHIENGLGFIIKHKIKEPLHADILTGVEVEHCAPLYYTCIDTSSLINTYQSAISLLTSTTDYSINHNKFMPHVKPAHTIDLSVEPNKLVYSFKAKNLDHLKELRSHNTYINVGSEMALNLNTCSKFFKTLANSVHEYNGSLTRDISVNKDTYIDQFNVYSLWMWHIIQIQTGIRPVNEAPGVLNQFNLDKRLYWVSDKANKNTKDYGRLIPISNFLAEALENYLQYLNEFAASHNQIYLNYPLPYRDILDSQEPLLNVFSYNPKGFIALSPSRVRSLLGKFINHKGNWLRHQLRTMLTNSADELLIRALYGHENADQEIFHPISSLSINDYKKLSKHLDYVADQLSLDQVKVKLYG